MIAALELSELALSDPRLDNLDHAVSILRNLSKRFIFSAHLDATGLYLRARWADQHIDFHLETPEGAVNLTGIHYGADGALVNFLPVYWEGPWFCSRPRWAPESVAGLVIAALGMYV